MHEVLVNRLGGLSLPRKSVVRLTDRPDMTLDVWFKQYFICILIQNLQTYQYIVTYILGTQMGLRRKSIDFCESVSHKMFTVDVKQQCNNNNKSSSSPEQKNESGINGLSMRWY